MADGKTIKTWTPNETQNHLEGLGELPRRSTLKDIELDTGVAYKTGAINILVSKGLVVAEDSAVKVNLVYRDTVIGAVTKNWKVYKLAEQVDRPDGRVTTPFPH